MKDNILFISRFSRGDCGIQSSDGIGFRAVGKSGGNAFILRCLIVHQGTESCGTTILILPDGAFFIKLSFPLCLQQQQGFQIGRQQLSHGIEHLSCGFGIVASAVCAFEGYAEAFGQNSEFVLLIGVEMAGNDERVDDRVAGRPGKAEFCQFVGEKNAVKPNIMGADGVVFKNIENVMDDFAKFGLTLDIGLLDMRDIDDFLGNLAFGIDEPVVDFHDFAAVKLDDTDFNDLAGLGIKSRRFEVENGNGNIKPLFGPHRSSRDGKKSAVLKKARHCVRADGISIGDLRGFDNITC